MSDPTPALRGLSRLVIVFRSLTLTATVIYAVYQREDMLALAVALSIAALASYLPLRHWERFWPQLVRHPALLGGDLALAVVILHLTGAQGPFFLYVLGTAALAGILYGRTGATVIGLLLVAAYASAAVLGTQGAGRVEGFESLVLDPLLFLLTAAVGVALRGLLERQAATEAALVESGRALAVSEERGRMAREMHDSVAKTLEGVALSAAAVEVGARKDPEAAAGQAKRVSDTSRRAAAELRALIGGLRADDFEGPLDVTLRDQAERWAQTTGIPATIEVEPVTLPSRGARHELLAVAKEALANVERHAQAERVEVSLGVGAGGGAVLSVADDGIGVAKGARVEDLEPDGHYGLLGMSERAERLGGRLELDRGPMGGLAVTIRLPPPPVGPDAPLTTKHASDDRARPGRLSGAGGAAGQRPEGAVS